MRQRICKLVFLVAGCIALASMPVRTGHAYYDCTTDATRSAHGIGTTAVTSLTFVNLPGAYVVFNTTSPCVRVEFSAQIRAKHPRGLKVRAFLNGAAAGVPAAAEFYTSETRLDGRTVLFTVRNVPAGGAQSIRIQVLSMDGTEVAIGGW